MATCAADGTPNIAYLSQVDYVDTQHVALSFQFFNKTRANVLVNARTKLIVGDPQSGATYRLDLEYLRTETEGALFERMKAKLAGIAAHTGMAGIFRLRGADVYRVHAIEQVGTSTLAPKPARSVLAALRNSSEQLRQCADLDALFDATLRALQREFDIDHAMLLLLERAAGRLYAVASHGYDNSGVGGEIPLGEGVIGIAAQAGTPIRIGHMTAEYGYGRAVRAAALQAGLDDLLATEIPLPGLPESRSQLAVPVFALGQLLGVLFVESTLDSRFGYDDEDALCALAAQLGLSMLQLQQQETADAAPAAPAAREPAGEPVEIRHYRENDSVFLSGEYLIKGVAGAIFRALVEDYIERGRRVFTNRELRLDPRIRLPELSDNLEARLILLARRLDERNACVRIEKCGRGQFHLRVDRPLRLSGAES
jgi:adenylate cyclase